MNEWVRRSIDLAREKDYLDQLSSVYPISYELRRPIDMETRRRIIEAYDNRDKKGLISLLLEQEKFPFLDPFVGSLREPGVMDKNPATVDRLWRILSTMGKEKVINGIEEPPQANRQLGPMFKRWLSSIGFPILAEREFIDAEGVAFLAGSEGMLRDFANRVSNCRLEKKPDFVAKTPSGYIVGEAKFLTTPGGNQDKSFREVKSFVEAKEGSAQRVGIMDGVLWFKDTGLYGTVRQVEQPIMSALLLFPFLKSLTP